MGRCASVAAKMTPRDTSIAGGPTSPLRIFINYRRDDTSGYAGLLNEALTNQYGQSNVFMDVDTLDLGVPFEEAIIDELATCDVLIALIGREWLSAVDDTGRRRLDNEDDHVRREISAALERGIRVIPVLAEGVSMPRPDELPQPLQKLAGRQAFDMSYGARWRVDREILIAALDRLAAAKAEGGAGGTATVVEPAGRGTAREAQAASLERAVGERPPRRLRFRRRTLIAAAAVIAVAVGAGLAAVLATRGSDGAAARSDTAYPDAIEADLLLAHVPEAFRMKCERVPVVDSGVFLRSVRCPAGAEGATVTYSRAHSGDALRAAFLNRVNSAGIVFPTKWTCRARQPAADEWVRNGVQTHVEGASPRAEGRALCYSDSDTSWMVWTDTPTKIFAVGSRPLGSFSALYAWWRSAAGPEKELAMGGAMHPAARYPDTIERELLLGHIPANIRKTCVRSEDFDHNVFLRAVRCSQGAAGTSVTYSYSHSGTAMKTYADVRATAAGITFPTTESCRTSTFAADTWMRMGAIGHREALSPRQGEGRVLCFENSGAAWIEWSDVPTGVYAAASRPTGERRALYKWWQENAGPGTLEGQSGMGGMGMGG